MRGQTQNEEKRDHIGGFIEDSFVPERRTKGERPLNTCGFRSRESSEATRISGSRVREDEIKSLLIYMCDKSYVIILV